MIDQLLIKIGWKLHLRLKKVKCITNYEFNIHAPS